MTRVVSLMDAAGDLQMDQKNESLALKGNNVDQTVLPVLADAVEVPQDLGPPFVPSVDERSVEFPADDEA